VKENTSNLMFSIDYSHDFDHLEKYKLFEKAKICPKDL